MRNIYVSFRAKRTQLLGKVASWLMKGDRGGLGKAGEEGWRCVNSYRQTNKQTNKQTIRQSISMLHLNRNYCQLEFCERFVYLLQMFMLIYAGAPFSIPGRCEHQLNTLPAIWPQTNWPNGTKTNRRQVED